MNDLSVAIIIVTYNGMPWISKCLESTKTHFVIVVDNNSTDETLEYIKKHHPEVAVLPQDSNLGFGQANNIGISHALNQGAEYVFLLNQDAYLMDDCVESLIAAHKNNPKYGILSPIHLNGKGDLLDRNFSQYARFDANPHFYSDFVLNKSKRDVYELPFVNAAGWLIPKKCLEIVGGFDPIFFHYGEDDNYCQRVHYHGFKIGVVSTAFLKHDRENREAVKVEKYSKAYFDQVERSYKLKYGNINTNGFIALEEEIKRLKTLLLKLAAKFQLATFTNVHKELQLLKKINREVEHSRSLNSEKGRHYL